jgi:hypothetical protein
MVFMSSAARKELFDLVSNLPDDEVPAARRYLQYLRDLGNDPVWRSAQDAAIDEEEETAEEAEAVAEARKELAEGKGMTTDELRRELGL